MNFLETPPTFPTMPWSKSVHVLRTPCSCGCHDVSIVLDSPPNLYMTPPMLDFFMLLRQERAM